MDWVITKQIQSSDGKTEKIHCELTLNFPSSNWNKKEKSPVIRLCYYDYKIKSGWWIDKLKTQWYTAPPHKRCEIHISYLQRHPDTILHSSNRNKGCPYKEFTIDYCKEYAIKLFTERLTSLLEQLK